MKHSYLNWNHNKKALKPKKLSNYFYWLIGKHSHTKFVKDHELELLGIPLMLEGLAYHYRNFSRIEKKAQLKMSSIINDMQKDNATELIAIPPYKQKAFFEISAYLNTIGRIDSLLKSWWIEKYLPHNKIVDILPSLMAIMPFRHKCSAHRSFDAPLGEKEKQIKVGSKEVEQLIESHLELGLVGTWRGQLEELPHLSYNIRVSHKSRHKLLNDYNKPAISNIEVFTEEIIFLSFIPSKHHKLIIEELTSFTNCLFSEGLQAS